MDHYTWAVDEGGVSKDEVGQMLADGLPPGSTFTGFWRDDWFPWLSGDPEEYAIACDGDPGDGAPVWRVNWHPDAGFETAEVAPSVHAFVDRVVDLFRASAYAWDPKYSAVVPVEAVFERLGLGLHLRP